VNQWWCVPDIYALLTTGKEQVLKPGMRAIWSIRALYEAGIITAPLIPSRPLPQDALPSVHKLYDGFCYLLRLRSLYDSGQEGTPFSWAFAAHWCGIGSPNTIARAQKWLLSRGYLRVVPPDPPGGSPPCTSTLFALGDPSPVPRSNAAPKGSRRNGAPSYQASA
jgi:hypothetical protein